MKHIRAGFVGFGEVNSPRDIIEKKCVAAKNALFEYGIEIIDAGVVTDDEGGLDARGAIEALDGKPFDALVLCAAGWIPSYTVIRIADRFKHLPMALWGLAGSYENGCLVTTADQAGTAALRKPMEDLNFMFAYFYDTVDGQSSVSKIAAYLSAAAARKSLVTAKIGMMGYRDMNLYGTMFDGISLKAATGIEIEFFDMYEVVQKSKRINPTLIRASIEKVLREWEFAKKPKAGTLETGIAYYHAIAEIVRTKGYTGISLCDVDGMKKQLHFPPSMIFMLLANELDLCTTPENDALGSATQLISKELTGQISMYLECYEFMRDRVLMGVPDYVPREAVDGSYRVMPSSFGLLDEGILNVSVLKTGVVTMCRLYKTATCYGMHIAAGQAVTPRLWQEAGWAAPAPQLPGLEIILDGRTDAFIQNIMSQHYIVTYGDNVELFSQYCKLCGISVITA